MLIIRLQRTGKKNQADFRIVLAEKTAPVEKKFAEVLGTYNPRKKTFVVKQDRVKYWLDQHVALTPTVNNLFVTHGVLSGSKVKAFSVPKKPAPAAAAEGKPAEPAAEQAAATPAGQAPSEQPAPVQEQPAAAAASPEAPNPDQAAA